MVQRKTVGILGKQAIMIQTDDQVVASSAGCSLTQRPFSVYPS